MVSTTPYVKEYGITVLGELICLNEYASSIVAETTKTHVALIEDFAFWMSNALKVEHIDIDASIDEFQMAEYTDRERLHYCHSVKCISIYDYFKTARKKGRNVFQFPYHLKLAGASIKNFPEVVKQ